MVGRGGFEPPKSATADLQSAPFGHSGTYPQNIHTRSWRRDSNPQPADYKSAALPIELRQRNRSERYPVVPARNTITIRKGLEPSTSSVTGWHSNQLNYRTRLGLQGLEPRTDRL